MTAQNEKNTQPVEARPDPGMEVAQVSSRPGGENLPSPTELAQLAQTQKGFLEIIEGRNQFLNAALPLAVGVTRGDQWIKMGKYAWPTATACEIIMRRFAIKMYGTRFEKRTSTDEKGIYYIYTCFATFELPGGIDLLEAVGTSSSRKPFFGRKTEWVKVANGPDKKITHYRPLYEIDEDNIMKAARSNCIANGVQDILGIRHLTMEDLKSAGVAGDIAEVNFGGGKPSSGASPRARKAKASSKAKSKKETVTENPEAFMGEKERGDIVEAFLKAVDYVVWIMVNNGPGEQEPQAIEDKVFSTYLVFGSGKPADRDGVMRFRKNKGLRWIEKVTAEIKEKEDFSQYAAWESSMDPHGEDPSTQL